jgi:hypothetical protein
MEYKFSYILLSIIILVLGGTIILMYGNYFYSFLLKIYNFKKRKKQDLL